MKPAFTISIVSFLFFSYNNFAQPASLDASFANNGTGFYTIPNESATAACRFSFLQPNGKIILGGPIGTFLGLARLKTDGSIDSSFGADGKILSLPSAPYSGYNAGVMQVDGKFLIAGTSGNDMLVVRYLANGGLDKTFNGTGRKIISIGDGSDVANAIALQPDGKIIVAGYSYESSDELFSIARLNPDGSLDNSFDMDGKKDFSVTGFGSEQCRAVSVQVDGKILLAGRSHDANSNNQFSIARINTDGSFDNTFNGTGKQVIQVAGANGNGYENAMTIQLNGKILLAGRSIKDNSHDYNMAVVRLNQDGSIDNNFDVDGKVTIALAANDGHDEASAIAVDQNDKIVVSGFSYNGVDIDFAVVRLNRDGSFDLSFDGDGKKTFPVGDYDDLAYSMILTVDKIILSGVSGNNRATAPHNNMISDLLHYSVARLNVDGALDNSFDGDGKLILETGSLDDQANASALDLNGRILLAGSSLRSYSSQSPGLMRLTASGQPDNNFSDDGRFLLDQNYPNANEGNNYAVLRTTGGNIMVAGETSSYLTETQDFLVARLSATGIPDAAFGVGGYATVNTGMNDTATCMAIQADGKIVVAGCSSSAINGTNITIARLLGNGTPDNTFGTNGIKTITAALGASKAFAVAIQSDGKIVIGGFSVPGLLANYDFVAIRLNTNGSFDNTFGSGGRVYISVSNYNDVCYSMKLQPDGKIVLAGVSGSESSKDFALVRLNTNGTLDNSFDGDGKKVIAVSTNIDIAKSVALQQDGKIIVAGYSYNGKDNDPAVIRLNTDGTPDNTFDGDGIALFNYKGTDEMISSVNVQSDGKIVLAGRQTPQNESYGAGYFVMRLLGGSAPHAIGLENPNPVDVYLEQNVPNPVKGTTTIGYKLPDGYSSAKILVENRNGALLKEMMIKDQRGKINLDASAFVPGAYKYVLYVDGKMIGSKQMIVIR